MLPKKTKIVIIFAGPPPPKTKLTTKSAKLTTYETAEDLLYQFMALGE